MGASVAAGLALIMIVAALYYLIWKGAVSGSSGIIGVIPNVNDNFGSNVTTGPGLGV